MKATLPYTRQKCERGDIVYVLESNEIKKAWVNINDPFYEEMQVWLLSDDAESPNTNEMAIHVSYIDFRPQPETCPTPESEAEEVVEPDVPKAAPKKSTTSVSPQSPIIENALLEIVTQCQGTLDIGIL
jgi:hypothetical protein